MKHLFLVLVSAFCTGLSFAQSAETNVEQDGTKIIKGFVTQKELESDPAFKWVADNKKGYTPYAAALGAAKANKETVHFLVFGGTWCDDTKMILPKFFSLTDAAGFSPERMTIVGVDRSKKSLHHLTETFGITNVPTIIVMKGGKEIGRVVEYGKTGMFDKDLGEILSAK
jgi:thiol-disulfide isomerase/thioredoxin